MLRFLQEQNKIPRPLQMSGMCVVKPTKHKDDIWEFSVIYKTWQDH